MGFAVVFLAAAMMGCSAQKSGSKVDGSHAESKLEAEKHLVYSSPPNRSSVRIDYLRHVSDVEHPEVFVYKERRRLYLLDSNIVVRDYPVGLGTQPWGDREREGDGRTPEGYFMVYSKQPVSGRGICLKLRKAQPPVEKVWTVASRLSPSRVKPFDHAKGSLRSSTTEQPLWLGEFSIHGGGAQSDWTDGSVALYPSDMEELTQIVQIGTSVTVRP